ncbi:MAG: hypothetical protein Fur006_71070 [Coleofasciculaceae cyanobacterium]
MSRLSPPEDKVHVSFSDDSQTVATAIKDNSVQLWKTDGTLVKTLTQKQEQGGSVSFSPDGKILILHSGRKIDLWKLDGTRISTLSHQGNLIAAVIFSPDNQMIATSSWDGTINLWNRDGTLITTLIDHRAGVQQLFFSPDGKRLTSLDNRNTVILRRLEGLTDLDDLQVRVCKLIAEYLRTNPSAEQSDRTLCDGIGTQK